jgi:dTDP-glucose 4,6-dehydratase
MAIKEKMLVTGGAGFIGSHLCRELVDLGNETTVNPVTIRDLLDSPNFELVEGDILDERKLREEFRGVDAIIHAAAISSVDRSIRRPRETVMINALGTYAVLESARQVGVKRVHYVSTDEVFGHAKSGSFTESSPVGPRNPYAAGKLAGEAFMGAWGTTFGMEVTITNSVNNYGPYQTPDKLIPRMCTRGLVGNTLPVYGDGKQLREWLFVDDHVKAILHVLNHGAFGERYCVGSGEVRENIEIVRRIMGFLGLSDEIVEYVEDRKGHDLRYAVDSSKLRSLGWKPEGAFEEGLDETIAWYKNNRAWWEYYLLVYPDIEPGGYREPVGA